MLIIDLHILMIIMNMISGTLIFLLCPFLLFLPSRFSKEDAESKQDDYNYNDLNLI